MRTATRSGVLIASILLALPRIAQALIVQASVEPGTVVPIGTTITLTMTVTSETPGPSGLGNLAADPRLRTEGCVLAFGTDGWFSVYPDDPRLVSEGIPDTATVDFGRAGYVSRVVQWQFTATRTGIVAFSVVAADLYTGVYEGCADPSPYGSCGFGGLPYGTNVCSFATVTITSTLTGRLTARSAGTGGARPPGTAYIEDPVEVVMSLTNTGASPLALGHASASTWGTGPNVLLAVFAEPAAPLPTLAAGSSAMLTWSFSVTASSPAGTAKFWADVDSTLAYADPLTVVPAPVALGVTLWTDPDGAGPMAAGPLDSGWLMAGGEVWVVASLQNLSSGAFEVDPRVVAADSGGYEAAPDFDQVGARIPAAPQTLAAFTTRTFTWKYEMDRNDVYWAQCQFGCPDMAWDVSVRGVGSAVQLAVKDGGFSVTPEIPPVVQAGAAFSATLWVRNLTGRPVVLDASATVFLQPSGTPHVTMTALPPAGNRSFTAANELLPFVFTCSADSVGTQSWYGGIACYWDPSLYSCIGLTSGVTTEVVGPTPLVPSLVPSSTVVNHGTPYSLTLSLYNSSTCQATLNSLDDGWGLNERPIPGSLLSARESAGCPSLPCIIPASSTVTFHWSVTPYGCGDEDWSGTMTGEWDAACLFPTAFSRPYSSRRILLRQQAALFDPGSVSWEVRPDQVVEGDDFEVVCRVTPGGQNDIDGFSVGIMPHFSTTSTAISVVSTPVIPPVLTGCGKCVTNLCPEKTQSFTWKFTADARGAYSGRVWFTITASGFDPWDSAPVLSRTVTGPAWILKPSVITVSVLHDTTNLGNCQRQVTMFVDVVGDTPVGLYSLGVTPSGPQAAVDPVPYLCCSLTISGNSVAEVSWTWSPVGEGTVQFTASAVGVESSTGAFLYAEATTADVWPVAGASLGGHLSVYPAAPVAGSSSTVRVTFTVTNGGEVPASAIVVESWTITGSSSCGGMPAPVPVLAATSFIDPDPPGWLSGCGDLASFTWEFTTTPGGEGDLEFAVTVTGVKSDLGTPLSVYDRFCIRLAPSVYVSVIGIPDTVMAGREFQVSIGIENRGGATVLVTAGSSALVSASGDIVQVGSPPPAFRLGPFTGTSRILQMAVRPGARSGGDSVGISAAGVDAKDVSRIPPLPMGTAVPVPVNAGPPVSLSVIPAEMKFEIGENPWHPLNGPLAIRYVAPDGGRVTMRAYNLSGELVRTILDEGSAMLQGTATWDGRNDEGQPVAAGVYLLRFEGTGLKVTRKLAVVK